MASKLNKAKFMSLGAIFLIVASFAAERFIDMFNKPVGKQATILALVFTVLLGVVCFLISKTENAFFGLLAALLGYKMMPPDISSLSHDTDSGMLYFIVKKAAVIIFVLLIYKFYKMQEKSHKINALPILTAMVAVTFANGFSVQTLDYFQQKTGSMIGFYFTKFACYILASLVILIVAYRSNYDSMRFIAYYEFVALGINIAKRGAVVILNLVNAQHVSKSYYCWIAIYIVLIVLFYLAKEKKKKEIKLQC